MTDLIAKLRAALDEDERVAREACDNDSGEWFTGSKWNVYRKEELWPHDEEEHKLVVWGNVSVQSDHIARHDPARVLRQVAAMRNVLDIHEGIHSCGFSDYDDDHPCGTLLALADAYGIEAEHG